MLAIKLSGQKDERLWAEYKEKKGPELKEALIKRYAHLVKYVAGRLISGLPSSITYDELLSFGTFGLLEAIERFEPERGIKFETYAVARIKGAIIDGLRQLDWMPASVRARVKKLEQGIWELEQRLGRSATDEEICQALGLSEEQYQQLLVQSSQGIIFSLDELIPGEEENTAGFHELIADKSQPTLEEQVQLQAVKQILADAIAKLPEKEKLVVALYYYNGLTLKEIGQVIGVSESRVSQLHTKAIFRLRGRLSRQKQKIFAE